MRPIICEKCGKSINSYSQQHLLDDTYHICDECWGKLVDWINEDNLDWYDIPSEEMTLEQARSAVRELRKKVAEQFARTQNEWISVKDRLPEPNTWVLVYVKYTIPVFEFERGIRKRNNVIKYFYIDKFPQTGTITHWMPLPEPPKEQNND